MVEELRNRSKQMADASSSGKATVEFPGDTQILVTREFEAPSRLVYEAWTTPELIKQWWSCLLYTSPAPPRSGRLSTA